jgi:hypothetical protein
MEKSSLDELINAWRAIFGLYIISNNNARILNGNKKRRTY